MLWIDSEKRKRSLIDLVNLFYEKGYVKTSEKIIEFSKMLDLQKIPHDFEKQWASVVLQFEKEFAQGPTEKFREGCFDDIAKLVLVAIKKIGKRFSDKVIGNIRSFSQYEHWSWHCWKNWRHYKKH